jgi:hypothetical protein
MTMPATSIDTNIDDQETRPYTTTEFDAFVDGAWWLFCDCDSSVINKDKLTPKMRKSMKRIFEISYREESIRDSGGELTLF